MLEETKNELAAQQQSLTAKQAEASRAQLVKIQPTVTSAEDCLVSQQLQQMQADMVKTLALTKTLLAQLTERAQGTRADLMHLPDDEAGSDGLFFQIDEPHHLEDEKEMLTKSTDLMHLPDDEADSNGLFFQTDEPHHSENEKETLTESADLMNLPDDTAQKPNKPQKIHSFQEVILHRWLSDLNISNDGRPLYAYFITPQQSFSLFKLLQQYQSIASSPIFAACYCLAVNMIYRQNYAGGNWDWRVVDENLGISFTPEERNKLFLSGFSYWQRPLCWKKDGSVDEMRMMQQESGLPLK
ncbi:hypothetical protein DINO107042_03555 [Dichelobacter nodosus]